MSARWRFGLTSRFEALDASDLFFRMGLPGRDVAHPGGSHVVKFRRQTSKPAASSAPPRRATAPREKKPYMAFLHTRVNCTAASHSHNRSATFDLTERTITNSHTYTRGGRGGQEGLVFPIHKSTNHIPNTTHNDRELLKATARCTAPSHSHNRSATFDLTERTITNLHTYTRGGRGGQEGLVFPIHKSTNHIPNTTHNDRELLKATARCTAPSHSHNRSATFDLTERTIANPHTYTRGGRGGQEDWFFQSTKAQTTYPTPHTMIANCLRPLPDVPLPATATTDRLLSISRNGPSPTHTHTQEGAEEDRRDWFFQSTKAQTTYPTPHTMIANCLRPLPDVPLPATATTDRLHSISRNGPSPTHTHTQEGAEEDRRDWFFQSTKAQTTYPTPHTMIANCLRPLPDVPLPATATTDRLLSISRNGPSPTHTHTQEGAEEDRRDWFFQSTKAQITYPTPHT